MYCLLGSNFKLIRESTTLVFPLYDTSLPWYYIVSWEPEAVADSEGGGGGVVAVARPLNFDGLCCFFIPFCIRMLKNEAEREHERSSKTPRASRALMWALDPGHKGTRDSGLWCACMNIIFCTPPPWKSWIRPWEGHYQYKFNDVPLRTKRVLPCTKSVVIAHVDNVEFEGKFTINSTMQYSALWTMQWVIFKPPLTEL